MTRKEAEQVIEKNAELQKVFKEHPERKEQYIEKMLDSDKAVFGCRGINPAYCKTCVFAHGTPPFEDLPEKAYCAIYRHGQGSGKPSEVYYDGAPCEYYEKEKK